MKNSITYILATGGCLCVMLVVDYLLGAKAEHLNAWSILSNWLGISTDLPDSLAVKRFGLTGATLLMLAVNAALGAMLLELYHHVSQLKF